MFVRAVYRTSAQSEMWYVGEREAPTTLFREFHGGERSASMTEGGLVPCLPPPYTVLMQLKITRMRTKKKKKSISVYQVGV